VALPTSGTISVGMINYERANTVGTGTTVGTGDVATTANSDFLELIDDFFSNAAAEGATSRADLLAAPYGLDEFYGYTYATCVLIGTEILMADGSIKLVEDLIIDDEVISLSLSGMTNQNYRKYSIEDLSKVEKTTSRVKSLIFDFSNRYTEINKNIKATEKHAIFAKKNGKFEWWQMKDLEIGDELVTSDLKLEEIKTIEEMDGDFEVVTLGLRNTQTYFANGYLCHR
tara:strand:- start:4 stop:690 length:687 start_codon:yes stop_codon:yes gene_type:complete